MIDTELDLGSPGIDLTPDRAVLERVCVLLKAQGLRDDRATEIAMQLALLAGRRFQDDVAVDETPDLLARKQLLEILDQVENILHFITAGRLAPLQSAADTSRHLDGEVGVASAQENVSAGRLVPVLHRVADSEFQAGRGPNIVIHDVEFEIP